MRAPGMFLSQPPTATRPSMCSALTTVSMASAMTSRETREYFMPSVPIEIASLTVGVPNVCGMAPASRSATSARDARAPSPKLHGVMLLWPFATPTMGLTKSPSSKPTARSMARLPARSTPSVVMRLRRCSAMRWSSGKDHHLINEGEGARWRPLADQLVTVVVGVTRPLLLHAMPRVPGGLARSAPAQLVPIRVPVALQVGLDLAEAAAFVPAVGLPAVLIRRTVRVVGAAGGDV